MSPRDDVDADAADDARRAMRRARGEGGGGWGLGAAPRSATTAASDAIAARVVGGGRGSCDVDDVDDVGFCSSHG
jgi:hypothetical protein